MNLQEKQNVTWYRLAKVWIWSYLFLEKVGVIIIKLAQKCCEYKDYKKLFWSSDISDISFGRDVTWVCAGLLTYEVTVVASARSQAEKKLLRAIFR